MKMTSLVLNYFSFCIQKFKAKITLLEIEKSCLLVAKHLNKSITRNIQDHAIRKAWGISPFPLISLLHILIFLLKCYNQVGKVAIFVGKIPGKLHQSWRKVLQNSQTPTIKREAWVFFANYGESGSPSLDVWDILLKFTVHKQNFRKIWLSFTFLL